MATDWEAAALPAAFRTQDFSEAPADVTLRSSMDAGPAKVRRRFSANVAPLKGSMTLTPDQRAALFAFYAAKGGFTPFTMPHPVTGAVITARFVGPPQFGDSAPNAIATLSLEIMP